MFAQNASVTEMENGKRGTGVPGYGVRGPGAWKARGLKKTGGLMKNTGSKWKTRCTIFFFTQYSASRPETRFLITVCELNIS